LVEKKAKNSTTAPITLSFSQNTTLAAKAPSTPKNTRPDKTDDVKIIFQVLKSNLTQGLHIYTLVFFEKKPGCFLHSLVSVCSSVSYALLSYIPTYEILQLLHQEAGQYKINPCLIHTTYFLISHGVCQSWKLRDFA